MIPGTRAGDVYFGRDSDPQNEKAPTPAELGDIFDEVELFTELSSDAWLGLRRHAQTLEYTGPDEVGWLTCRPEPEAFHPDILLDIAGEERVEELLEGDEPTPEEFRTWQELWMKHAESEGGCGIRFPVMYWYLTDDRGRTMCLATLHGDELELDRVAGLFRSHAEAEQVLREYGRLE